MNKDGLIVHVEDNLAHATLLKRQINQYCPQVKVHHLQDGDAALDYLDNRKLADRLPQLLLLDLRLPKVNGLDVLRRIRSMQELNKMPVVILSTSNAQGDIDESYQCGANGYLVKPLESEQLREMVKSLCDYWLVWNTVAA